MTKRALSVLRRAPGRAGSLLLASVGLAGPACGVHKGPAGDHSDTGTTSTTGDSTSSSAATGSGDDDPTGTSVTTEGSTGSLPETTGGPDETGNACDGMRGPAKAPEGLMLYCDVLEPLPGDDAVITTPEDAQMWASRSSAPAMGGITIFGAPPSDPSCPTQTVMADAVLYQGGCTDQSGVEYHGTMIETQTESSKELQFQGWRVDYEARPEANCGLHEATVDGHYRFRTVEADTDVLESDIEVSFPDRCGTGLSWTQRYCAVRYDLDEDRGVWNGRGWVFVPGVGRVAAETVDEVRGSCCGHEALSGQTIIEAAGDEIVITYDGATDCDPESTVQWAKNGTVQGELTGIECRVHPRDGRIPLIWLGLLALGAAVRRPRHASS